MSERDPLLSESSQSRNVLPGVRYSPDSGGHAEAEEFIHYKRRWYILFVYSMLALTQSLAWNTWGPIASSAKFAYGWSNGMISLLASWGPIMFMLTVFPFSWVIETKGLRWATIIAAGFLAIGGGVRCITQDDAYVPWLMNIGQMCVSITGPLAMAAASALSATWFPPSQRTTATAIASRSMGLGSGIPFVLGPMLVTDIGSVDNTTLVNNRTMIIDDIKADIQCVMFIEMAMTAVLLISIVIYFPAKPPTPPSPSVANRNVSFFQGVKHLLRIGNFWLLGLPYAISYGVMVGWSSTLDINLEELKIGQKEAGLIGISGLLVSVISGISLARLIDVLKGKTKPTLVVLYFLAAAGSLLFALSSSKIIPYNKASLYVGRIVSAAAFGSLPPLVFETLCEACYPVPESVTNALVTWLKNLWCFTFLAILWIPNIGTEWMNWLLVGASVICIPLVIMFRELHGRLNIDYSESEKNIQDE